MRISDWSSDVCSSDLIGRPDRLGLAGHHRRRVDRRDLPALGMARAWGSLAGMACREGTGSRVIAMTWKPLRGKGGFVRAFLPLLTFLMLVLTSFSGMAHAADLAGDRKSTRLHPSH